MCHSSHNAAIVCQLAPLHVVEPLEVKKHAALLRLTRPLRGRRCHARPQGPHLRRHPPVVKARRLEGSQKGGSLDDARRRRGRQALNDRTFRQPRLPKGPTAHGGLTEEVKGGGHKGNRGEQTKRCPTVVRGSVG